MLVCVSCGRLLFPVMMSVSIEEKSRRRYTDKQRLPTRADTRENLGLESKLLDHC
jgi:hypothetical protein